LILNASQRRGWFSVGDRLFQGQPLTHRPILPPTPVAENKTSGHTNGKASSHCLYVPLHVQQFQLQHSAPQPQSHNQRHLQISLEKTSKMLIKCALFSLPLPFPLPSTDNADSRIESEPSQARKSSSTSSLIIGYGSVSFHPNFKRVGQREKGR
jgi:hypothetical protein